MSIILRISRDSLELTAHQNRQPALLIHVPAFRPSSEQKLPQGRPVCGDLDNPIMFISGPFVILNPAVNI